MFQNAKKNLKEILLFSLFKYIITIMNKIMILVDNNVEKFFSTQF